MYDKNYTIRELIDILNNATKKYDAGTPAISDEEWDKMYFELQKKEKETGIIYPDSPTQKIHFETVSQLNEVTHSIPMLSLDKTKDAKEIEKFVFADKNYWDWFAMFKMDGLSGRLIYKDGKLISAATRGDGTIGEDITHNALVMPSIPKEIPNKTFTIIDGEIILDYNAFKNYCIKNNKNPEETSPRNIAAGTIRHLDNKTVIDRKPTFVAWDLVEGIDEDYNFRRLEKLDDWGFTTVPRIGDAESVNDAIKYLDELNAEGTYPIDGYVFKFESKSYCNSLGRTAHHWNHSIAFKFYDEKYETELLGIEWSMGRTGILTPVAIFKPVIIDGTEISRANLHNLSVLIDTLGQEPELNQKIWVYKANQIIPQIAKAEKNNTQHDHCLGQHPLVCPICGKSLDVVESDSGVLNVVCTNKTCEGKLLYKIEHYCSKKGLDIKGISEKTIEKLINWGWINGIKDIYILEQYKKEWIAKEGFGTASVERILSNIYNSRNEVELSNFISGLGIPLVGRTVAKEIVKYYPTWDDFMAAVGGDWTELDGFGPEINRSINNFDYKEACAIAALLDFAPLETQTNDPSTESAAIKGKVFVITGKLSRKRDDIKNEIESFGGKVTGSVSSKTDYLINNDINSTTGKNKKAKELGIPIISEDDYLKMKN